MGRCLDGGRDGGKGYQWDRSGGTQPSLPLRFSPALSAAVGHIGPRNDLCHGVSLPHTCKQERQEDTENHKGKAVAEI